MNKIFLDSAKTVQNFYGKDFRKKNVFQSRILKLSIEFENRIKIYLDSQYH